MQVIRMEHPDTQRGPFRDRHMEHESETPFMRRYYHGDIFGLEPNTEDFPTPSYELERVSGEARARFLALNGEYSSPDTLFGTRNENEFEHWFDANQRHYAAERGFVKAVYEVPDDYVAPLTKQVAFLKSRAVRLREEPLVF